MVGPFICPNMRLSPFSAHVTRPWKVNHESFYKSTSFPSRDEPQFIRFVGVAAPGSHRELIPLDDNLQPLDAKNQTDEMQNLLMKWNKEFVDDENANVSQCPYPKRRKILW